MKKLVVYAVAEIFILAAGGVFCYGAYNDLDVEYRIDGTILLNDEPWFPLGVGFIPCPNQRDTQNFLNDIENLGRGFCFQEFADNGGNFLIFPCFHLNEPEPYNPPYFHWQDYMPCDVTDKYDVGEPTQCDVDLDAAAAAGIKIIGAPSLAYKWDHLVEFYPPYCRFMHWNRDPPFPEGLEGGVVGSGEERNTQSRTEYFNTVKQFIVNSGSEEAYLGWANCWEAVGSRSHTYLHQVHDDLRALETASSANHPVYLEVNEVARGADLYPVTNTACDLLGYNIRICPTPDLWDHDSDGIWGWNTYLLNNRWTSITGDAADMHFWSVDGAKTMICCVDAVWWREPYPFPPYDQIRFMSYDAIIHRVNGLYWGLWHYIWPTNPKCPDDGYKNSVEPVINELGSPLAEGGVKELLNAEFDDTALEVVVRKAGAVVERTAFLGGNLAPKNHYCSGRYLLEGCVKYRDEPVGPGLKRFVYLVAACREGRDTVTRQPVNNYDVTFRPYYSGAWPVNGVEVVNEDRTVNVIDGAFTDTFQGETVHIYKFEKPTRFGD